MADAKIEVQVGQFKFSGEGEQKWLAEQMDKILKSAREIIKIAPVSPPPSSDSPQAFGNQTPCAVTDEALPQFLQRTNATKTQVDRFLATAEWLHQKGSEMVKTGDVTQANKDAHQSRFSNTAGCLAKNASKGFCVKAGRDFYVTDEGRRHLGLM